MNSSDTFRDTMFHPLKPGNAQHIVVNPGQLPRYCVSLAARPENGLGEEMAVVEVHRYTVTLTGSVKQEIEAIVESMYKDHEDGVDQNRIFTFTGQAEKAAGYAQGMFDGLQIALGLAGRS